MFDRNRIEEMIRRMAKEPTSLKTVLDETQELYEQSEFKEPKVKRRKQDKRTLARKKREANRRARERGDDRRDDEGSLRGQFFKLRREYIRRARKDARPNSETNWEWNLSLAEWLRMWLEAGAINGIPAWKLKGRRSWCDVQLKRLDVMKPFEINNLQIKRGKQILWPRGAD